MPISFNNNQPLPGGSVYLEHQQGDKNWQAKLKLFTENIANEAYKADNKLKKIELNIISLGLLLLITFELGILSGLWWPILR